MNEKQFKPIIIVHIILVLLLAISSLTIIIILLGNMQSVDFKEYYEGKNLSLFIYYVSQFMRLFSSICCLIYILKGYHKESAIFYKLFLYFIIISQLFDIAWIFTGPGFSYNTTLYILNAILLIVLAFIKDLGKTNSLKLFVIMLAITTLIIGLDLITGDLLIDYKSAVLARVINIISKPVTIITIGLTINGKYFDKGSRNRE